jgi:acetyl esterase/lipase
MFLTVLVCGAAAFAQVSPPLMTPRDLQSLPAQPADAVIRYGDDPAQFGELRVPAGPGPHPVVVLIHGGCFKAAYATLRDLAPMGDALKAKGIASWSIEYRRLGIAGGGWPGTYADVGRAIDHLRVLAAPHHLDLDRLVILGHSAGGHLALWAAARHRLPAGSAVATSDPLRPRGAIDLAGPFDLRENIAGYEAECRDPVITQMMGGRPDQVPDRYRQASAAGLLPLRVPHALIWGEHETFMPRPLAAAYVRRARAAGDDAVLRAVPGAGHFEIASPHSAAWPVVRGEIERLLRR